MGWNLKLVGWGWKAVGLRHVEGLRPIVLTIELSLEGLSTGDFLVLGPCLCSVEYLLVAVVHA